MLNAGCCHGECHSQLVGPSSGNTPDDLKRHRPQTGAFEITRRLAGKFSRMPTITVGRMFFNDHAPPHFHARYGEFEATIEIDTLSVIDGHLPHRALNLVQEWATIHREELLFNRLLCRETTAPVKVEPLA